MLFTGFAPAISPEALKAISRETRGWRLHRRTRHDLRELADWINPIVHGWVNYYGRFYRSMLDPFSNASTPIWCAGLDENTSG